MINPIDGQLNDVERFISIASDHLEKARGARTLYYLRKEIDSTKMAADSMLSTTTRLKGVMDALRGASLVTDVERTYLFDKYDRLMVTREKLVGEINDIDYDLEGIMEQIRDELESKYRTSSKTQL